MTDGSAAVLLLRMVVSLGLVLLLVTLLVRYLQRREGLGALVPGGRRAARRQAIQVLGRHQFTRSSSIQVVRVGSQVHLLGVGDAQVTLLSSLDPADPQLTGLTGLTGLAGSTAQGARAARVGAAHAPAATLSGVELTSGDAPAGDVISGEVTSVSAGPQSAAAVLAANPLAKLVSATVPGKFDDLLGRASHHQGAVSASAVDAVRAVQADRAADPTPRRGGRHRG